MICFYQYNYTDVCMGKKYCCFIGHRNYWKCLGLETKLKNIIENLIHENYTNFYDGFHGAFDKITKNIIIEMKNKYPQVKLIKVESVYHYNEPLYDIVVYDEIIVPELEKYHYKQKLIKRNEWIIDNSDIVICHVNTKYKSGAYTSLEYAQSKNKKIIYV